MQNTATSPQIGGPPEPRHPAHNAQLTIPDYLATSARQLRAIPFRPIDPGGGRFAPVIGLRSMPRVTWMLAIAVIQGAAA